MTTGVVKDRAEDGTGQVLATTNGSCTLTLAEIIEAARADSNTDPLTLMVLHHISARSKLREILPP